MVPTWFVLAVTMAMPEWCEDWLQFVLASFERDIPLIEAADRACFVLEILFRVLGQRPGLEDLQKTWKALRLALLFQDPGAAAVVPVLLPLLWPYFTATLEHDARNSYVTFRAFRNRLRQRLFDGLHGCFMLLQCYCNSWILWSTCMYGQTWQKQCLWWKIY